MIYDSGFLGFFFPVGLYYESTGNEIFKYVGYASIQQTVIGALATSLNSDLSIRKNSTSVYLFNSTTGITGSIATFSLPYSGVISVNSTNVGMLVFDNVAKVYNSYGGVHYATMWNNGVLSSIDTPWNSTSYHIISSRDTYFYRLNYTDETIEEYSSGVWITAQTIYNPDGLNVHRAQKHAGDLYYNLVNHSYIRKGSSVWKNFPATVYDFFIDSETIVLAGTNVYFIETTTATITNEINIGSNCFEITQNGNYLAIRCSDKIVLLYNRQVFAEIPISVDSFAMLNQ